MFIQNVGLLCISMIVLGAVLGYLTPFIRRRLFGRFLGEGSLDFLPEQFRPQYDEFSTNSHIDDAEVKSHQVDARVDAKRNAEADKQYSKLATLATQRKIELDSYRGDVKQHFVDMAKILNDDHKDTDALNQAMISQIGLGAEQLVGARAMQGAVSNSAVSNSVVSESDNVVSNSAVSSNALSSNATEINNQVYFDEISEARTIEDRVPSISSTKDVQTTTIQSTIEENASLAVEPQVSSQELGSLQEEWIPAEADDVDEYFAASKRSSRENRFQEIAEGIEGKSNTLSGVKNWFRGARGAAKAALPSLPKGSLKKPDTNVDTNLGVSNLEVDERLARLAVKPKQEVHYENGVLIDESVLDSKWNLEAVQVETLGAETKQVETKQVETAEEARLRQAEQNLVDTDVRKSVEQPVAVDQDYRSAFVYIDTDHDAKLHQTSEPVLQAGEVEAREVKTNTYDDASTYMRLQQDIGEGSSPSAEFKNTDKTDKVETSNTKNTTQTSFSLKQDEQLEHKASLKASHETTSDMLDPYDRITDAVLKDSSNPNLNDEKKIVHELFYVRGHQSNISGRAMSNINPGIRKDN